MSILVARAALTLLLLLGAAPAWSQAVTPTNPDDAAAEISLWKVVTGRGLPLDYQGYLRLYPDGRFASLARLRLQTGAPAPAPMPTQAATPVRPLYSLPPELSLYHLDVTPPVAAAGQPVTLRTRGFLPAALFDLIVVVPAGAPDLTPAGALDESVVRVKGLAHLYDFAAGAQIPAQPPGSYEVRYLSRQYNPNGTLEVMARSGIVWR